jgi:hypothetical protein
LIELNPGLFHVLQGISIAVSAYINLPLCSREAESKAVAHPAAPSIEQAMTYITMTNIAAGHECFSIQLFMIFSLLKRCGKTIR